MFIRALKAHVPVLHSLGLTPLSIVTGLLPFTIAGVGSRDIAVIFFYQEYLSPSTAAALGILLTARYVILAIAGLPFIGMMSRAR